MDYSLESQLKHPSLIDSEKRLVGNGATPDIGITLSPGMADCGGVGPTNLHLFGLGGYASNDVLSLGFQQMQEQNGSLGQPQRQTQSHDGSTSSALSDSKGTTIDVGGGNQTSNTSNSSPEASGKNGGPSEEELYQRRKAQNRAAQRAFRERKEGKIKELSNQLQDAELSREKLETQLNELKEKNKRLNMENQMLQKQQQYHQQSQTFKSNENDSKKKAFIVDGDHATGLDMQDILSFKFPNTSKCDFIDGTIDWTSHGMDNESEFYANKIGESYRHDDNKVLTISAVWDYLVEFANLNEEYTLDIPGIMHELRGKEVCHGFGPAYPLQLVNDIILRHLDNEE